MRSSISRTLRSDKPFRKSLQRPVKRPQIAAHNRHINEALDTLSGQGLTALVTYGSAHKYMILDSLAARKDIEIADTRALFEEENA